MSEDQSRYNAAEVEPRWQNIWAEQDVFKADDSKALGGGKKFYALEMFPYPSGRIHMGHVRNYAMGDVVARYKKAQGFDVLHPMGWDAFGMPAENAAIEKNVHPKGWTYDNIDAMRAPLQRLGFALDWSREFATCDEAYYKQQQYIFLKFWEKDLVYRKTAKVNWDPVDNTVLANEQVIDGKGWRSGAPVEQRDMDQWFFKITHYAQDLLDGLDTLERWPEKVRTMQANWIGKSEGLQMRFEGEGCADIEIYTTRPDTMYGASFIAISADHPLTKALAKDNAKIENFREKCAKIGTTEEAIATAPKLGFDTGLKVKHPFTAGKTLPVYIANFVLMGYGTGAVFGCPAHDQRDLDFARKYNLEVNLAFVPEGAEILSGDAHIDGISSENFKYRAIDYVERPTGEVPIVCVEYKAYLGEKIVKSASGDSEKLKAAVKGINRASENTKYLYNRFLGKEETKILTKAQAISSAITEIESAGLGEGVTQYRLRDWGVSRQRYWGCPIPVIKCESCGPQPVALTDLPVQLPEDINFDKPGNPLDRHPTFRTGTKDNPVTCPKCGERAERETDTLDTFADSSWYFARFAGGQGNGLPDDVPFDKAAASAWMPVDQYVGGVEHAVLHLLYARFFTRGLIDCGLLDLPGGEPFAGLFTQGMVTHAVYTDADGKYVVPADVIEEGNQLLHIETRKIVTKGDVIKMSKSKKNTVDPNDIIEGYGADVARWFVLSDSPPERDVEWTESGVIGAWRFSGKIWSLIDAQASEFGPMSTADDASGDALALRKFAHKALDKITAGIEAFRFNTSVAQIYELTNALKKYKPRDAARAESLGILIRCLAPFMPHLAEECWAKMGGQGLCYHAPWPQADAALLVDDEITMPIQVNGKRRAQISVPADMDKDGVQALAMALAETQRALDGLTVRKVIVVPKRIINIVAS